MNKRLAAWLLSVALFCFCTLFIVSRAATAQDVEFVLITLMADRTSVARGYGVTLSADAATTSGEVASVEFFADRDPIPGCRLLTTPYQCEWTPDREDSYNITARATDDMGRLGDSADTPIDVVPPLKWISSDGLEVVFTPDPEPLLDGDLLAGTLSVISLDGSEIVTFGEITMHDLHHVGVPLLTGVGPTVTAAHHHDPDHALYDSHLLITPDMIGGSAGDMLRETGFDDPAAADPAGVQDRIPADDFGNPAYTYAGDIVHGDGAFFLRPSFQSDSIDLARLVGRPGDVSSLRFEVLGDFRGSRVFDFEMGWSPREGNPPTIQFNAPTGLVELGDNVVLSALAHDEDGDLALVEFFDNGELIPECSFSDVPYECVWTPPNGTHNLRATATDEQGHRVFSDLTNVSAESFSPSVKLTNDFSPIGLGDSLTLTAEATARFGEIAMVEFFASNELIPGCRFPGGPIETYECEWTPNRAGTYGINAIATDDSGRSGESYTRFAHVESDSPLVTLTADRTSLVEGDLVTFSAEVTPGSGEITLVEFLANNELIPGCSLAALPYECEWTPESAGSYNVRARATDEVGGVGSDGMRVDVESPLAVTLTSPPNAWWVNRTLWSGESLTLAADVIQRSGEEITLVKFLANDELIPGCSFTMEPYECEWIPDEGEHVVLARAEDSAGNVQDSASGMVAVFPRGTGGIDLPRDENGDIAVEEEFEGPSGFGGPPQPIQPGFPVRPLSISLPVAEGGPATVISIEEIADEADIFAYAGDPPPLRFESRNIYLGPFDFEPLFAGEFSAMYEVTFDDGSRVVATLSASVVPEPGTLIGSIFCLMGLVLYVRRNAF